MDAVPQTHWRQNRGRNLRQWHTGGLRRLDVDKHLPDSIPSGRTPKREEAIANHPCLKPPHFMRVLVRSLLPLGKGTLLDPFMGSGSTIAAAEAIGYESIGIEIHDEYFQLASRSISRLAALYPDFKGAELQMNGDYGPVKTESKQQMAMGFGEIMG